MANVNKQNLSSKLVAMLQLFIECSCLFLCCRNIYLTWPIYKTANPSLSLNAERWESLFTTKSVQVTR